jgi:hypothetical protein
MRRPAINESTNAAVGFSVADISLTPSVIREYWDTYKVGPNRRREPTTVADPGYQILQVTDFQIVQRLITTMDESSSNSMN